MSSEDWDFELVSVTDGDTVRANLSRSISIAGDWEIVARNKDRERGVPLRLIILDTPERAKIGWATAAADAADWLHAHRGELRVRTYGSAGWDRLLADIYVDGDRNDTLTQHMLRLGWDSYLPSLR